jgi:hypothetical protein
VLGTALPATTLATAKAVLVSGQPTTLPMGEAVQTGAVTHG